MENACFSLFISLITSLSLVYSPSTYHFLSSLTMGDRSTSKIFWVDSFATYAYSCGIRPLEFFIVFRLKNNKKFQQNTPFGRWRHFTTKTRIRQGIAFLSKLRLLLFTPHWDYKFNYERKNEMNSGLSSEKTSSCKWPILFQQANATTIRLCCLLFWIFLSVAF